MFQARPQRGFALLEVMIAGTIAIGIIFALFTAIHQAGNQTHFIDLKKDERNLLSDLKYVLQDPTLCKDRIDLTKEFRIGDEVQIGVRQNLKVGKGTKLAGYGVQVDSLKVIDTLQVSEDRNFDSRGGAGCGGTVITEHFETQHGQLVQTQPDPRDKNFFQLQSCKGGLGSYTKTYYMDLEIQASGLNDAKLHFRPERLARVTVNRTWSREKGNEEGCVGVSTGADRIPPADFALRTGRGPAPAAASLPEPSNARGNDIDPRYDHHFIIDDAAPEPRPASVPVTATQAQVPAPSAAPAPAPQQECVVNGTLEMAQRYGWPTIKPGEHIRFESGECQEREYMCLGGALVDTGLPPVPVPGCKPSKPVAKD